MINGSNNHNALIGLTDRATNGVFNTNTMNYWNGKYDSNHEPDPDRRMALSKSMHLNAENSNLYQQQSSTHDTDSPNLNVKIDSNSFDQNYMPKLTTPSIQIIPDDLEKPLDVERNPHALEQNVNDTANNIIAKQLTKTAIDINSNMATTEQQLRAEIVVDNYPINSESHDFNWTSNSIADNTQLSDVDTNEIDVAQQSARNTS